MKRKRQSNPPKATLDEVARQVRFLQRDVDFIDKGLRQIRNFLTGFSTDLYAVKALRVALKEREIISRRPSLKQ